MNDSLPRSFYDLVTRIIAIAKMSETELSSLMGTKRARKLVSLKVGTADPDRYLENWERVKPASPGRRTEAEYELFLRGRDPHDCEA